MLRPTQLQFGVSNFSHLTQKGEVVGHAES
jgi:hypothetical protein